MQAAQEKPRFFYAGFYCTGWARKKFPLMKTYNIKSTSQIWMIQILVKSQKIEVFLRFFCLSYKH